MSFHMRGVFNIAYLTSLIKRAMILLGLLNDHHVKFTVLSKQNQKNGLILGSEKQ